MLQRHSHQINTTFEHAVDDIAQLYLGDLHTMIENIYSKPLLRDRDPMWQVIAASYPTLQPKILHLHHVLNKAYLARYNSSLRLNAEMDSHFASIGDGDAAALLIDILYTRLLTDEGSVKENSGMTEEEQIKKELNLSSKSEEVALTLNDVISAVLIGQLKLPQDMG